MGGFGSGVTETYKRGEAPLSCSEAGVNSQSYPHPKLRILCQLRGHNIRCIMYLDSSRFTI